MAKILFIGGTGLISSECAAAALRAGHEVFVLTRGKRPVEIESIYGTPRERPRAITADIGDEAGVRAALGEATKGGGFDCVANFIAYKPADVERDVQLFGGLTRQYVLIATAAAYQKPPTNYVVTEGTPLANPFWQYARDKIACEEVVNRAYREAGFPGTIVRPSLTYGRSRIPAAYHNSALAWTTARRMLTGKPVIVHGDGTNLWQVTHAADFAKGFVGLLANPLAIGHAFHITTDEVLTWNQILLTLAGVLGVEAKIVHVPTEVVAHFDPEKGPGIVGDKQHSVVLDNSKIKRFVPGLLATIPLHVGLRDTVAWFREDPARMKVDEKFDALTDRIIAAQMRVYG